jgi:hypothetical protein
MLPRLLPAPQALLKASRPTRMPETHAKMTGVYSGVTLDTVGFFANIMVPTEFDRYPPFAFHVIKIEHANPEVVEGPPPPAADARTAPSMKQRLFRMPWPQSWGLAKPKGRGVAKKKEADLESGPANCDNSAEPCAVATTSATDLDKEIVPGRLQRHRTLKEKATDVIATLNTQKRPAVPARFWSPLHIVTIFSFLLSLAILVSAIYWHDGNAIIAVSLISFASSIVGYASWWEPRLMSLTRRNRVPKSDIMIRTREGAFILIKCTESVARELFAGTEECKYHVGSKTYNALMALGTVILMLAVVLLGNCKWNSQMFIGGSYIVLNGLYWSLGMIPKDYFWDLSRYTVHDVTPADAVRAHKDVRDAAGRKVDDAERLASYTRSLWYAIRETRTKGWAQRSGAAARTVLWSRWLEEAERAAREGRRDWKAVARKDEIFAEGDVDEAEEHAPASEVQGVRSARETGSF